MDNSRQEQMPDRAIDFSLGLLSADEERALLEKARQDPEFESVLRTQCAMAESARAEGVLVRGKRRRSSIRPRRLVIAGAALAASLTLLMVFRPQPAELFWLPVNGELTTSRGAPAVDEDLRTGVELYASQELDEATEALRNSEATGATADLRDLYLASALLNDGRPDEAREVLDRIDLESLPHPWRGYGEEIRRRLVEQN